MMQIGGKVRSRKLIHNNTGHVFPDDFTSSHVADLKIKEQVDVEDIPESVRQKYVSLSRDELLEIARSPDAHAPGTYERMFVYRLRAAFGCSFPSETGVSHVFHPLDDRNALLGTPSTMVPRPRFNGIEIETEVLEEA